jgi:hypothetical protein
VPRAEGRRVAHPLAADRPQVLEELRRRDDRGPRVEDEAVLAKDPGATAGLVMALEDRDVPPANGQPDGGGEAAEAASDDDGVAAPRSSTPGQCRWFV